jgi:preprotein translocase subunit SecF
VHEKRSLREGLSRLYHGENHYDILGKSRIWLVVSAVVVAASIVSLATQGLNLGIDFEGGVVWEVEAADDVSIADVEDEVGGLVESANVQELTSDDGRVIRVQAEAEATEVQADVTGRLAELTGASVNDVSLTSIGPSWGDEITEKAIRALVIFLGLLTIYITLRFELRMAGATIVALLHDIVVTVGVYSIFQIPVTPATLIAVLTILGFSIYDGVVVFDRVDENTHLVSVSNRLSYRAMVNRSLNEVLMRTVNTTIAAVLPVLSVVVIGSLLLGASALQDFGLALLVGLLAGTYSSILVASPLLVLLKEREPRYREVEARIENREVADTRKERRRAGVAAPAVAGEDDDQAAPDDAAASTNVKATKTKAPPSSSLDTGTVQPRGRKVKKRRR